MDLNENTFTCAAVKLYDILKVKNALVKSTYYLTEYTICNFVIFTREKKIASGSYSTDKIRGKICGVFTQTLNDLITLRWIFRNWVGGKWTGLIWLRIGSRNGHL
jgi:hypothetical protein